MITLGGNELIAYIREDLKRMDDLERVVAWNRQS